MSKPVILACHQWRNNADLIANGIAPLYLSKRKLTLDPTYGKGVWWKLWRPHELFDHDLEIDGHDFRNLPYDDNTFAQIGYDPPYVSMGGRATTKIKEFYERYGLVGAPTSPAALQRLINDGLTEMARLATPNGIILVKCQNYISSGHLWTGELFTQRHALRLGLEIEDIYTLHGRARPQPKRKRKDGKPSRQQHARQNSSTMLVLRRPKRWDRTATVRQGQIRKRNIIRNFKLEAGCADCGYNENPVALDFDHVRGTKLINIGREATNASIAAIIEEMEKCDVVCSNCHRIRTDERELVRPQASKRTKYLGAA